MRVLAIVVLLSAIACAGGSGAGVVPGEAPQPAAPTGPALRLPPTVAGFNLSGRRNFDDPRAGSVFRYVAPDSLYADVFLYPGPDLGANCNVQCATRVIQQEAGQFEHTDLPAMVQQNSIQSFTIELRESLQPPADSTWKLGAHVRAMLQRGNRTETSEFYVYYIPRTRVKIRVSYLDSGSRRQAVEAFIAALMPALVPPRT